MTMLMTTRIAGSPRPFKLPDTSECRDAERQDAGLLRQTQELLRQKEVMLQEMQHRVGNSLQLIASILMLKARSVPSEETRLHLIDAHRRVMAVAAVQEHLNGARQGGAGPLPFEAVRKPRWFTDRRHPAYYAPRLGRQRRSIRDSR